MECFRLLMGFLLPILAEQAYTRASPDKSSAADLKSALSARTSAVRLPLPVQEAGFALPSSIECPTSRCYCQFNSKINRYIINCRHQKLADIPQFSTVNTVFYEITFSMRNYITKISNQAFRNLKVERIDLLSNSLVSILPGAFSGLETYLKELLIEGNGNIPPPYTKISNLNHLRTLRLQKFQQYSIEQNNYFDRFPELEILQLYEFVSLSAIDGLAFQNKLQNLRRLEIMGSVLANIPVQSLTHLPSLNKLYIKDSQITTIYSGSFTQLHNLTDLDLSYNKIKTLENEAFQGICDQLKVLDLTFNELSPESLTALSGKTWLQLKQLTLSYNKKLGSMPEKVFQAMPVLEYLSLVQLNLRQITKNLFAGLKNLHTLDLSWNKIEVIYAGAFEHMPTLHELKLNKQFGQTSIPSDFAMQLSPESLQGCEKSLAILNLQATPVQSQQFWRVVKTLTNLQFLRLSNTRLSNIPNFAFFYNTKLQELELEDNGIHTLTADSFTGPTDSLQIVSLNSNNISTISSCVFKHHVKLESVCLAQNPLACDCNMYWLYKLIVNQTVPVGPCFKLDFICSTPQQFRNKPLYDIPLKETCSSHKPETCSYKNITTTTAAVITITEGLTAPMTATAETIQPTRTTNELSISIVGRTTNSIAIVWNIKDKTGVTGFILEYHPTTDKHVIIEKLHRDKYVHSLTNLKPGLFYSICVTAEMNQVKDHTAKACRTTQTDNNGSGADTQTDNEKNTSTDDMNSRNILIGVILGSLVFVILVVTGLYLVVKYKVQRLKTLQLTLAHLHRDTDQQLGSGAEKVCTVDNEYTELAELKKLKQYHTISGKHLQRQHGVNSTYTNIDGIEAADNDNERDRNTKEEERDGEPDYSKAELEQRHSAPSRLNAGDLLRKENIKRSSRPLPATPTTGQTASNNPTLITTQVSVYEQSKNKDHVYYEIP